MSDHELFLSILRVQNVTAFLLVAVIFSVLLMANRLDKLEGVKKQVRNVPQMFDLVVTATKNKMQNMNKAELIPDIPPHVELRYAQEQLKNGCQFFSENLWIKEKLFTNLGDEFTQEVFRKIHKKWGQEGIIKRIDGRGTWGAVYDARGMRTMMKNKVAFLSPSASGNMPKLRNMTGE